MGLLQKQRQVYSTAQPLYNIAGEKTYLIAGLGNTGKKYADTRHNIGFLCIDDFAARNEFPDFALKKDLKCMLSSMHLGQVRVILAKPAAMMNLSGQAVGAVQSYYKLDSAQTAVIYDELALPFGQIRMRTGGESAGHNGVKSLIEHIGEDFNRVRVGVGSPLSKKTDSADFVLGKFSKTEQAKLSLIAREVSAVLTEFVYSGQMPHDTRNSM